MIITPKHNADTPAGHDERFAGYKSQAAALKRRPAGFPAFTQASLTQSASLTWLLAFFITGAAGWVGGDFVALLQHQRPAYQIRALVRSLDQARTLNGQFPNVQCVVAPPEPHSLLVGEGEAADVVVQIANSDDEPLSLALLQGVAKHAGATYLHVSGIATLIDPHHSLGQLDARVYRDDTQTADVFRLPLERAHAQVEHNIIDRAEELGAKAAIVSLPVMYGKGRGHETPHNKVFEPYLRAVARRGRAFAVGDGLNVTSKAHVSDTSSALLLLVDEALKGASSKASWGREGYYFVETSESSFADDAKDLAEVLRAGDFIDSTEVDGLDTAAVASIWSMGPGFWGASARCRAERLRALGWQPSGISRKGTLGETADYFLKSSP